MNAVIFCAWLILFPLLPPADSRPDSSQSLPTAVKETVVVSARLEPVTIEQSSREIVVIDGSWAQSMPLPAVGSMLSLAAPVDVRPRVPGALLGDLHVRGSNYAGTLICIDGLRWNDAQTGHFNLNLPVPPEVIGRLELVTGSQATIFGSDAVGGLVNVITAGDRGREICLEGSLGSFQTRSGSVLGSWSEGKLHGLLFAKSATSDGFIQNRDYGLRQVYGSMSFPHPGGRTSLHYGYLDHRYGAQGFYGSYPSYETNQAHGLWSITELNGSGFRHHPLRLGFLFRQHSDHFYLYRSQPSRYENHHRTRSWMLQANARLWSRGMTSLSMVAEAGVNTIASNRLGHHQYTRGAAGLDLQHDLRPGLTVQGSLRYDRYSDFGGAWAPGAGMAWFCRPELKLRCSYGRAFRVPSFTELYYESPSDLGNSGLVPETAHSIEGGADWYAHPSAIFSWTVWRRFDREVVDWVRYQPGQPWRAKNIGRIEAAGLSIQGKLTPLAKLELEAGYTFTSLRPDEGGFQSKYALEAARHQISLLARWRLARVWEWGTSIQFKVRPSRRQSYTLAGSRLSRRVGPVIFYIQGENLTDSQYEDFPGLEMPGRSITAGIRLHWPFTW